MNDARRQFLLKAVAFGIIGLFIFDRVILSPSIARWKEQSERIASLREKVQRGRQLVERERSIRGRWADMLRTDLSEDVSAAENDISKAVDRWARASRVGFTSLTRQWRDHEEGYQTLECRATVAGDQASLARLLYELESDPMPAYLQGCEFNTRDPQGKQLTLAVRFSFIRLSEKVASRK